MSAATRLMMEHDVVLQLSEDALLQLAELGYSSKSSRRALRFSGGDVAAAVDFLTAQAEKKQVRVGDTTQLL